MGSKKNIFLLVFGIFVIYSIFNQFTPYNSPVEIKLGQSRAVSRAQRAYPEGRQEIPVQPTTLVTAFDASYIMSSLRACKSLRDHPEIGPLIQAHKIKVVAYILGVTIAQKPLDSYKRDCPFVEVKNIDYAKLPKFFSYGKQYRWKPYIMKQELETSEIVFWFDSSIIFKTDNKESFKDIITSLKTTYSSKCGIRVLTDTGHTINAATHPDMYKYFNVSDKAKHMWMPAATSYVVIKTEKSKIVIERMYQCALEEGCMGPRGTALFCNRVNLWKDVYANCHRFDQSALGLALGECTDDYKDFGLNSDLVTINRMYA